MGNRILLVEDDTTLSMIISETLQRDGFDILCAGDGEDGLLKFTRNNPDLIIADVMMPKMDGFEMLRKIRQVNRSIPFLFLTAKSEINDIVEGFELGCNDYLKKPFRMLELIVRVKALLQRIQREEEYLFSIGDYILNMKTQTLEIIGKKSMELSLIEAKLLKELSINAGQTVESSTLMLLIWQRDDPYSRNSLHGFVHKLRHYLRFDPSISILNQRGIGYMLTIRKN